MKKSIEFLFYALCILFSLGQIARISYLGQQINAYIYEIPLFIVVILLVIQYRLIPLIEINKKVPFLRLFFEYLLIIFLLTSFFYPLQINLVGFLYLFRLILYFLFFIYVWFHTEKNHAFQKIIFQGLSLVAVITVVFSLTQYVLYPNLRNISYLGWDPHWYRMVGTFFDPPVAGAIYGLFFIYFYRVLKIPPIWKYTSLAVFATLLFLTYSRGTYLAFFIVALPMFFQKKIAIGIISLAVVGILIYFLLPRPIGESVNLLRTFTISSRVANYQEAIKDWSKHPFIGTGYNRIRYARDATTFLSQADLENNHAGASYHSSFLIILISGGIIGLGLFIGVLYGLAKINDFSLWSVLFLSLLSITDNVILHPFVLLLFLTMIVGTLSFKVSRKSQ